VPGPLHSLTLAVARFDTAIDMRVDAMRGHPHLDHLMYTASELGNFSLIWHLVGTTRALGPDRRVMDAVRVASILGIETALVNGPVKNLFRRHRPAWEQERPRKLRRPRTSSFPSGHASSAFTAAGVLSQGDPLWPVYYAIAAVVASSRVYVKIHHPSDVVAGALVGIALAQLARRLWPMSSPEAAPSQPWPERPGA
jgi:undecaprenyl-diphosphatase